MAAEFIAWRGCPLQRQLGPDGFVGRLRLADVKRTIDRQFPDLEERQRAMLSATGPDGAVKKLTYAELVAATEVVDKGIADCAPCMLSEQRALGCHTRVSTPIDAVVERLLFTFFTASVGDPTSTSFELWRDVVRHQAGDTVWHTKRGDGEGALARLPAPLTETVTVQGEQVTVDSGRLLASLFLTSEGNAQVVAYHKWWTQLLNFSERPGRSPEESISWRQIINVRQLFLRTFIFGMHQPVGLLVDVG